jgi:predicted DNA-binding ribbon-helix-helix protein
MRSAWLLENYTPLRFPVLDRASPRILLDVDLNAEGVMKSPVVKRSIVIAGHKTSVSLEDAFWKGLKEIAMGRDLTLSQMVAAIDSERAQGNLSSALRLFVLDHFRAQIGAAAGGVPLSGIEPAVSPAGDEPLSFARA